MFQKSITCFFQRVPKQDEKSAVEDSPIKSSSSKKKRQRIASSSEEEDEKIKSNESPKKKTGESIKSGFANKLAKFSASKNIPTTEHVHKTTNGNYSTKDEDNKTEKAEVENGQEEKECVMETDMDKKIDLQKQNITETVGSPKKSPENKEMISGKEKTEENGTTDYPLPAKKSKKTKDAGNKSDKKSPKSDKKELRKTPEKDKSNRPDTSNYNPSTSKYHPIEDACWKKGEKVPYLALARTFEEIENVSARLKMIEILSNYFRSVIVLYPEDLLPSVYLCLNKLGPAHEGVELGLAEATLIRAISQSTGRTVTQIRNESQETGDLGIVAERSRTSQRLMFQPAPLTVSGIFKRFKEISSMTGQSAVNKKISLIQSLFVACKGSEARFLIRSLNGKLRIGLAEQSVLQALALACTTTPPTQTYPPDVVNAAKSMSADTFKSKVEESALVLKTTYCECPNYDLIIPVILKEDIPALPKHCRITPGIPMKPMLAHPTKGVQEVLTRFDGLDFTCEWKYDGERAQIHICENGEVKIFSRNQEDNTTKYPDLIGRLSHTKKENVKSCILDCEAVAWDREQKKILPFQILSTRKRKDANESDIKVQVCVFMFDLLYLNGRPLVKEKFFDRRQLLHENFLQVDGEWQFATAIDTSKMEEVQDFLEVSIKGNCEGLMVKTLTEDATYEIAKRSRNWLKLKKDYLEGVGDTLDLVVMGGYLGKGKRTGTYGGFLIGCYDEHNEEYQSLCKIGTGFSDESLATHTEFFKSHIIPRAPAYYQYDSSHEPDHWFEPVQVWEVKCADLSLSPVHRAAVGVVDPVKGISLRFPRFLRIRDDKKAEDATTAQQVADMYQNQEQVKNQHQNVKFNEEDFY